MSTRNLYVVCGPSASGKTTIVDALISQGFSKVRTCTTRSPRVGESADAYYFLTTAEFLQRKDMLTATRYSGAYYGVYPEEVQAKDLFIVEPQGVALLKKQFSARPIKVIGLKASDSSLQKRLAPRGEAGIKRFLQDKVDFLHFERNCDVVFINEELETTIQKIAFYIKETEKLKT